jgi:hypothetical protein
MAFLYITEYAELALTGGGRLGQIPQEPPLAEQTVAVTGTSAQSAALNAGTRLVRLHADSIIAVSIGANPTATVAGTNSTKRMAANQTEYVGVPAGSGLKIAAIVST